MADAWGLDRRRSERREVPFPLQARLEEQDRSAGTSATTAPLRVSGLSVGGMVLESPTLLPVRRPLSVVILRPDGDIGPIAGRVVHSRLMLPAAGDAAPAYVAGVAFEAPPAHVVAAIEALLFSIAGRDAAGDTARIP